MSPSFDRPIRVLSLSALFPNAVHPARGIFVSRRLQALGEFAEVKTLAPVLTRFGRIPKRDGVPYRAIEGSLEVFRPRCFYAPGSGVLTPAAMYLQLLRPAARLHRVNRFDILDAHFGFPDGVCASLLARSLRIPFAITLRGSELYHAGLPLQRVALASAFRRAACIVCLSDELRVLAVRLGAPPERTSTIPNGIDAEMFYPRDREACRRRHGLPLDRPVVLSAGYLVERKGHHHSLKAVSELARRGLRVELVIAGGSPEPGVPDMQPQLRRLASELGIAARFVGHVPPSTLAELMSASDVFCLASSREGCPNVVLEALACGLPVVAAAVGGIPQMIPSSRYGFTAPSVEPQALAAALELALSRLWDREAISAWGRSRSWREVAREAAAALESAIRPTPARAAHP